MLKPITSKKFQSMSRAYKGLCIECGATRSECEPDARLYNCPKCKKNTVYGMDELLVNGMIELV